MGVPEGSDSAG